MEYATLFTVDKSSRLPLYDLIEQNFRSLISSGQLEVGFLVPSELELCEYYQVSRMTIRKAMDELAKQGWIIRRQGVGTFVQNPKITQIQPSSLSFTKQMALIGRTPSSKLISLHVVEASTEIARKLMIAPRQPVYEIIRIRMADEEPILLETAYLLQECFPDLPNKGNLEKESLYKILADHYAVHIATMDQFLEPIDISQKDADLLGVQPGSASIFSEVISFDGENHPIEYAWSISSGNKAKFYFTFHKRDENY